MAAHFDHRLLAQGEFAVFEIADRVMHGGNGLLDGSRVRVAAMGRPIELGAAAAQFRADEKAIAVNADVIWICAW